PGDRVLLLFPPGRSFVPAFLGTLLAGAIAVPAYTPDPSRMKRTLARLLAIIRDSGATHVLTTSLVAQQAAAITMLAPELGHLGWTTVDGLDGEPDPADSFEPPRPDAVAYLQYTSGSTTTPRGVRITHANLVHNVGENARITMPAGPCDTTCWLPVHHDFGLMAAVLLPLHLGRHCTMFSPLDFIRRPALWLECVSRFRTETTGGPTFGYALAARKVTDVSGLDLSHVRGCVVSAEHVRAATLDAFIERFAPAGLRPDTFIACYGLAETVVTATGTVPGPPRATFDPEALAAGRIELLDGGVELVSSGHPSEGEVAIVDAEGARLPERTIGSVWLRSESIGDGYWKDPPSGSTTFGNLVPGDPEPWLSTGDLGFLHDGELYITGRQADRIVVQGRTLFAEDVEEAAETAHPACR
ncbi:MAG: AMP-binding protein, partial [Myxococcales bacterium]|nr:AMP-binding protein [Myxococcales bacterium]